jgi:uncharacterized protein with NAD-binding domain and iron-sulfur cluster
MAAAWELSKPKHGDRYAITVYQMGFRLGGKGASGRGVHDRIEEHGLHLWLGFYENAFALMREVYEELGRDPERCRIAHWWQALVPDQNVAVADRTTAGGWQTWLACFPPGDGLPGDGKHEARPFTIRRYFTRAALLVVELLRSVQRHHDAPPAPQRSDEAPAWLDPPSPRDTIGAQIDRLLEYGKLLSLTALIEGANLLAAGLDTLGPATPQRVLRLIDMLVSSAQKQLEQLLAGEAELRRVWTVIDLVLACIRGGVRHGLAFDPRGFDAINDYDWIEWLRLNGASEASLRSGFMQAIYDLTFAYADGDPERPALAAGVAMRGATRMFFTYRGALFWKMTAGMGDVVFAPLYEALRRRGVRFEFFHRLTNVAIRDDRHGAHVAALEFDVQAATLDGREYQPLVDVRGLPCWPALPRYEQLVDGERHRAAQRSFEAVDDHERVGAKSLRVQRDFDFVVLGLGLASIPSVCAEILARDARWRELVRHCKTVATQAAQLWMREDMAALGWSGSPTNLSGYVRPFATWADMRQLIAEESLFPTPRALAYLCCVLPERELDQVSAHAEVRANAIRFLERDVGVLWPGAIAENEFRWSLLWDARDGSTAAVSGPDRIDSQYWIANIAGSARYSQSVPGSIAHRISPLDRSYDNLTITGDWTRTGLDSGCVESAVMSGLLSAHAIAGSPALEEIIGYDHP